MPAKLTQWIDTRQRTNAEIFSELAACPAEQIILCRKNPADLSFDSQRQVEQNTVFLQQLKSTPSSLEADITAQWPASIGLWVRRLSSVGAIIISGQGLSIPVWQKSPNSLWEFILHCLDAGVSVSCAEANVSREMFDALVPVCPPLRHPLVPTTPAWLPEILRKHIRELPGVRQRSEHDVTALRAGLFQWQDALDESHEQSQSIEGQGRHRAGDYWHAIMHRREPDYGNSKYWFRRVGSHPIFPELARRAEPLITASLPEWKDRLLQGGWNPFAFVDFCESVVQSQQPDHIAAAEAIQEIELLLLLASTYQDATAS